MHSNCSAWRGCLLWFFSPLKMAPPRSWLLNTCSVVLFHYCLQVLQEFRTEESNWWTWNLAKDKNSAFFKARSPWFYVITKRHAYLINSDCSRFQSHKYMGCIWGLSLVWLFLLHKSVSNCLMADIPLLVLPIDSLEVQCAWGWSNTASLLLWAVEEEGI